MKVNYGEDKSGYGPGVEIHLDGDELASAVHYYVEEVKKVEILGPRTIKVNGELCDKGYVYVDPSGGVNTPDGGYMCGRGPQYIGALADSPLRGKDAKWNLATVLKELPEVGLQINAHVAIMVKYQDGHCIVDPGNDEPMRVVHFDNLRPWNQVEQVNVRASG